MKKYWKILFILIILSGGLIYLQSGREIKVVSTMSSTSGNYYEENLTVLANKLVIMDKRKFAEELIEHCRKNDFREILFSNDVMGYPNKVTITVYPNEFSRNICKGSWKIIYAAEGNRDGRYNIKDHVKKFEMKIAQ